MATDSNLLKFAEFDILDPGRRLIFKQQGSDRLKTLGIVQDINSFIVSMWQALQIHRPGMVFEPAYPHYVMDVEDAAVLRPDRSAREIPEELITWNVVRRTAGSLDGNPFARTREIKPRVREELVYDIDAGVDDLEPEVNVRPGEIGPIKETAQVVGRQIEAQFFDNLVQFDIWSKNPKTAESLAQYLEDFMDDFRGMFIELGVTKLHFHSRIRDEMILNWRNGLVNRSLLYYVRTEKVRSTPVREIRHIHVDASIKKCITACQAHGADRFLQLYRERLIKQRVLKGTHSIN